MQKFKFPVGSLVIWADSNSSKHALKIVRHDLNKDDYIYSYQPDNRQYPYPREQMERLYKIYSELQTFKFPINSLISWNKDPDNVQFRVTGYNYSVDLYNLIIEKYNRDETPWSSIKVGYRFDYDRKITEAEHSLVKPKVEFKFPVGSIIYGIAEPGFIYQITSHNHSLPSYNFVSVEDRILGKGYRVYGYCKDQLEKECTLDKSEVKPKFKVGDVIIRRQNKNCSNPYDFTYTILYIDAVDVLTAYDRNNKSVKRPINWLDDFEIYKPKIPKCIPADPTKSGWHWITADYFPAISKEIPKFWHAPQQKWCAKNTSLARSKTAESATVDGWKYLKPCEY